MKPNRPSQWIRPSPRLLMLVCIGWISALTALAQNSVNLIGFWDFDDSSNPDQAKSRIGDYIGVLENGVVYTADQGGRSGESGDRAVDFGTTSAARAVRSTDFATAFNAAAREDKVTISVWIKWNVAPVNSSVFWFVSTSSGSGNRGLQGHVPYGNGQVYFDTSGCCAAPATRLNFTPSGINWLEWHHIAYVKNGPAKEIYIDGKRLAQNTGANPLPNDDSFTEMVLGLDNSNTANQYRGLIDEFAVFGSALSAELVTVLYRGTSPMQLDPLLLDADNDGLPGVWEELNGFNNNDPTDAPQDTDNDGLTNLQEFQKNTLPRNPDSDDDGFKDGVETGTGVWVSITDTGTDPLNPDADGDLLKDGVETNTGVFVSASDAGTDPFNKDTDGDTFPDYSEVGLGTSPVNANSTPNIGSGARLIGYWDFNDATDAAKSMDKIHAFTGNLVNGAVFTADAAGRTGQAGDRGVNFGTGSNAGRSVRVTEIAAWLQAAAVGDQISISFWQKWNVAIANSSAFWLVAPSIGSGSRGMQAHVPYGNGNVYFDTGVGGANNYQRINAVPTATWDPSLNWLAWHHLAFVKNGESKQIWIDGKLFLESSGNSPLPTDMAELVLGMDFSNPGNTARIVMDDFAIFGSGLDEAKIIALSFGISPLDVETGSGDADGDGLPNFWEDAFGLNKNDASDATQDPDSDTLNNLTEYQNKTNPKNADSDEDGSNDGAELAKGTLPLNPDSDNDGLKDGVETGTGVFVDANNTGTNPLERDSDGDLFSDASEVQLGSSPVNPASGPHDPNGNNLLAYWDFNEASDPGQTLDRVHGWRGELRNGAVFTTDQGGRSGRAGDRAVDFGTGTASGRGVRVMGAYFLNAAGVPDVITVSYWQKWNANMANSSAFWFVSPSSANGQRGAHAESTWGDTNIPWDTGGTTVGTQRIQANFNNSGWTNIVANTYFRQWRHLAFVKNGTTKQIWIDGRLYLEGENSGFLPIDFTEIYLGVEPSGANNM
ncbi:MAG: LamG-like jellyroll fold domain-containing protein, partial [Verrucomicrobiota bacterium]